MEASEVKQKRQAIYTQLCAHIQRLKFNNQEWADKAWEEARRMADELIEEGHLTEAEFYEIRCQAATAMNSFPRF